MSCYKIYLTPAFLEFQKKLEEKTSIEIELLDERLSSKAADALPGDKKNKASRDALAAMLILQDYLDRL
jgi:RNase H-fold protein (predicted Holliday junction resolvase)